MDRIAITLKDLDSLVRLVGELTAPANSSPGCEQMLISVRRLVPFEHCIVLHERRSPKGVKTYRQEYAARSAVGHPVRVCSGLEMFSIGHYVEQMSRTNRLDNAFSWACAPGSGGGTPAAGASLTARLACCSGIGGLVSAPDQSTESATLLLLLLQPDEACVTKYVAVMNAVMRPLHASLQKSEDFPADGPIFGALTVQEAKVMRWVVEGKTSWEVGMILSISERTVKFHLANIYAKLKVVNRVQAVSLVSRANKSMFGEAALATA